MYKRISISCVLLLALLPFSSYSQSIPVKARPGSVSTEEVKLSSFDADTTADVLVLWDKKEVLITYDADLAVKKVIRHTERVKILKEDGRGYMDRSFRNSYETNDVEYVDHISAVTWNMVDGKVVVSKMPKSAIKKQSDGDYMERVSFSPVDVRVGSVVEVSYEITSDRFFNLGTFYLQRNVPVNLCELSVSIPDWLRFSKNQAGYCDIEHKNMDETHDVIAKDVKVYYVSNTDCYRAKDLPAMKADPCSYGSRQYMTSISYTVKGVITFDWNTTFNSNWNQVDASLLKSYRCRGMYARCRYKDEVKAVLDAEENEFARLSGVRNLVLSKLDADADAIDINQAYASALISAGYKVEPVFIRERDYGIIQLNKPDNASFTSLILSICLPDGSRVLVDAADKYCWFNLLDADYMVNNARIPRRDGAGEWLDLRKQGSHSEALMINADLAVDGVLSGTIVQQCKGLHSAGMKHLYDKLGEDKYLEMVENGLGIQIGEATFNSVDGYGPSCSSTMMFTKKFDKAQDRIYIRPFIKAFHSRSTFRNQERVLPVDFPYPESIIYNISIRIPEGYELEALPDPVAASFPNLASAVQMRFIMSGDNCLTASLSFKRNSCFLPAEEYAELRDYWEFLCNIYDSVVVIKKL